MNLITTSAITTMSSREIAELVEKRHDVTKLSMERLAEKKIIDLPPLVEYLDSLGRPATEYRIGKRDSYIVVAQLSPEFTARLVDRWQELEAATQPAIPKTMAQALRLAADQAEQIEAQQLLLEQQAPKVEALDRIATSDGLMCITDAAKSLQVQPKRLFGWLQQHQWIYRRAGGSGFVGYQNRIQSGCLSHKVVTIDRSDGSTATKEQVLVTAKGLTKLAESIGLH